MFCRVRFIQEPISGQLMAQVRMTYGDRIQRYDYWGYTSDVKATARRSMARPKIIPMTLIKG